MSRFENTVYAPWAEHEPFGPWADCVICAGDASFQVPCECDGDPGNRCMPCIFGGYPCLDMNPNDPGCVVPNIK
jgi:hypothetical protein